MAFLCKKHLVLCDSDWHLKQSVGLCELCYLDGDSFAKQTVECFHQLRKRGEKNASI